LSRRAETLAGNSSQSETASAGGGCERLIAWLLLAGAALVPVMVITTADDIFRLPKELVLRTVAILGAALAVNCLLLRRIRLGADERRRLALPAGLAAAGLLWAGIAAIFSSNRALSVDGLVYLSTLLVVVLLSAYTFRRGVPPFAVAAAVFLPALVNGTIALLQASGVWNPWVFGDRYGRSTYNALLGNVNDVGAYLVPPIVFAFVLATVLRRLRWLYAAIGAVLLLGLMVTLTLTSIIATGAALAALGVVLARRTGLRARWVAIVAGVLLVLAIAPFTYAPLEKRLVRIARSAASGEIGKSVSGRFVPFAAAWEMFRSDPFTGVGPGCFKFNYLQYRLHLDYHYPRLLAASGPMRTNFGETHNDHLQVLAESGIPGFLILLAGLVYVARISLRRKKEEPEDRTRIAATLALPLVVGLAANMLAGFPLQLAAPAYTYAILGGACIAWRGSDDPA
jgi:O-antigen ligase